MATKTEQRKANLVDSWDEVPTFVSEVEEREFWEHHAPSDNLLEQLKPHTLEEEMAAMVRLTGTGPDGDFDLTLDLPEDVRRELAAASRSPVRLNTLERLIINQVQLIATLIPQSHSTPEHPQSSPDPKLMEPKDELGWMDNLKRAVEATNETPQLIAKINEGTTLLGQKLTEASANFRRVGNNHAQVKVVALRTATFMSSYAEELNKDVLNLRKYTSIMSEGYRSYLEFVADNGNTKNIVETQKEPITSLRESMVRLKEGIIWYVGVVGGAEGHQRELTRAAKRLRNVLSGTADAVDEVIVFADDVLQKLNTLT